MPSLPCPQFISNTACCHLRAFGFNAIRLQAALLYVTQLLCDKPCDSSSLHVIKQGHLPCWLSEGSNCALWWLTNSQHLMQCEAATETCSFVDQLSKLPTAYRKKVSQHLSVVPLSPASCHVNLALAPCSRGYLSVPSPPCILFLRDKDSVQESSWKPSLVSSIWGRKTIFFSKSCHFNFLIFPIMKKMHVNRREY